ncbi:MAG: CopM family metallochaperone [Bosea sp. (in: a-proteobacteria)]|uniref:CopM family metallochaperone n=1 Tax=Bosea sp. (in: a-proteobacteria) TaxID=1871050 RepID=UPI003F7CBC99
MMRLALTVGLAASMMTAALAQPAPKPQMGEGMPMKMMMPEASDSASTKAYKASMMRMMQEMPSKFTGDADVDFMMQMKAHHQGAIDMAKIVLANGKDPAVKKLATEIVSAQEKEIKTIDGWLKTKGK